MSEQPASTDGRPDSVDRPDESRVARGRDRERGRTRRRGLRVAGFVVAGLLIVALASGAWMLVRGKDAKAHLEQAQASTELLRTQLLEERNDQAAATLAGLRGDTARARALTSDPVWRAAAVLPFVGDSVAAITTSTDAVDDVAQEVLPVLVGQADALTPSSLRAAGNRFDLAPVAEAAPALVTAEQRAAAAAERVEAIDRDGLIGPVGPAVEDAREALGDLARLTAGASDAAQLLPSMLGADGPRRYFLAFQSNAELRGTGGLVGAYGVVEADRGRIRVVALGPRTDLDPGNLDEPAVDFGEDYRALYGDDPGLWVNTNLSPHFAHAAKLWLAMYEKQTGTRLDGAIATDPVALGYLLGATGPARLTDGTKLTADNAASLTMRDVYTRYPDSDLLRDAFLQDVARAAMDRLLAGEGGARAIADALGRAAGERRLAVYSTDAADQKVLATTALGGSVAAADRDNAANVGVHVNATKATKLDFYLRASARYEAESCGPTTRASVVTLDFANRAPRTGLPSYVTGVDPTGSGAAAATSRDEVSVHLPEGAKVRAVFRGAEPIGVRSGRLLGRPVVSFPLVLGPGEKATYRLELAERVRAATPSLTVQPLAEPAAVVVRAAPCG